MAILMCGAAHLLPHVAVSARQTRGYTCQKMCLEGELGRVTLYICPLFIDWLYVHVPHGLFAFGLVSSACPADPQSLAGVLSMVLQ